MTEPDYKTLLAESYAVLNTVYAYLDGRDNISNLDNAMANPLLTKLHPIFEKELEIDLDLECQGCKGKWKGKFKKGFLTNESMVCPHCDGLHTFKDHATDPPAKHGRLCDSCGWEGERWDMRRVPGGFLVCVPCEKRLEKSGNL